MTTPSTPRKAGPLLGTGAQTSWPFTFKVFAASDIAVTIANNLGVETALVLGTDYSVTLNANQDTSPGGTVTYPLSGSPLPVSSKLTIIGNLPYDQPLDLPSGGNFSPLALENELDRLTMQIQQLREQVGRSLTVPVTSGVSPSLPAPVASNIIGWNESGSNLENYPLDELATSLAFATYRYDTFTGNGVTTQFTLSADPVTLGNLDVAISGVTQVPGADYTLANGVLQFTSAPANGTVILARFGEGIASGPSMDSYDVRFKQAGTGTVDRTAEAKMREVVSVTDYGASSTASQAANKTALQTAITAVNAAGGGQIVVDYKINFGVKTRTPSTWPDFTGVTSPIIIFDYSEGATQEPNVYPNVYDGMQYRVWSYTPPTVNMLGANHDGNTQWLRADWAPAYCISNDANLASVGHPSRNAADNRRAYYATMVDGSCSWQLGNGTLAGASYTDEELSNFVIEKFAMPGDTLSNFVPYLVERKTGNVSYSGGRNTPAAHHHFEAVTGSPALGLAMFESKSTTSQVVLRNSNGSGDDIEIRNASGDIVLFNVNGTAMQIKKATRYVGIGEDAPLYRFDLAESRSGDYVGRVRNINATNGYLWRWDSASAAGTGWTFLDAFSSGGDREYALRGDGNAFCDGSWTGGGADYAEFFEWADGNPTNEDRRGFSVSLVNGKIQKARPGDAIIGVISGNPSVVGDSAWNKWAGKYLRDDFGSHVLDENGHRVLNPAYDPEAEYTPRSQRPEWGCVGLMGKLRVRKGQPVGDRWIKMREVSGAVEEWLVR